MIATDTHLERDLRAQDEARTAAHEARFLPIALRLAALVHFLIVAEIEADTEGAIYTIAGWTGPDDWEAIGLANLLVEVDSSSRGDDWAWHGGARNLHALAACWQAGLLLCEPERSGAQVRWEGFDDVWPLAADAVEIARAA